MRIVDAHTHVLDRAWIPAGVRRAWARQGAGRRLPERDPDSVEPTVMTRQSDPDGSLTLAAMDRCGVATSVIPVVDWTLAAGRDPEDLPIRDLHDRMAKLAGDHRGRFVWCAGIDPRHHDASEILSHAVEAGCVGFKLYPAAGWSVDDLTHQWVFETALDLGLPVVVHTSPLGGDPLHAALSRPAAIAGAMASHPEVTWVLAHAGFEAWWEEACDIASGWQRCYLELSLWQRCAQRDYGEFRQRVARAVERVGAHRLMFGSDIIRGTGADPDGAELERWIEQFCGLAEPYEGAPAVLSQKELALAIGANADRVYQPGGRT
jgi:predicted TIM-barrel fold metal-dependent hydrolase